MRYSKRQPKILELVRERGSCGISELAETFGVSLETIRRDLRPLADSGQVLKLHGNVMLPNSMQEPSFQARMRENAEAKERMARATFELIDDGASLMIETGSTMNYVARRICERAGLTVVTNSVEIARIMASRQHHRIYLAGGELRIDDGAALGNAAIDFVRQFTVQYGVISAGSISATAGLTNYDLRDSEFCNALLRQSRTRIAVLDGSKFDQQTLVRVCALSDIDILVTDSRPGDDLRHALADAGVRIVIAD